MKEYKVTVDKYGTIRWYNENGKRHREGGPAIEWANGTKKWYINGECHREDGPAVEWADGTKRWYINDELHREDGPAIERANGDKYWYINGECHREDGPAVEWADGTKRWYINDEELTEEEFNRRLKGQISGLSISTRDLLVRHSIDKLSFKNQLLEISRKLANLGLGKYALRLDTLYISAFKEILNENSCMMNTKDKEAWMDLLKVSLRIGSGKEICL